jgi:hypothetical protein
VTSEKKWLVSWFGVQADVVRAVLIVAEDQTIGLEPSIIPCDVSPNSEPVTALIGMPASRIASRAFFQALSLRCSCASPLISSRALGITGSSETILYGSFW